MRTSTASTLTLLLTSVSEGASLSCWEVWEEAASSLGKFWGVLEWLPNTSRAAASKDRAASSSVAYCPMCRICVNTAGLGLCQASGSMPAKVLGCRCRSRRLPARVPGLEARCSLYVRCLASRDLRPQPAQLIAARQHKPSQLLCKVGSASLHRRPGRVQALMESLCEMATQDSLACSSRCEQFGWYICPAAQAQHRMRMDRYPAPEIPSSLQPAFPAPLHTCLDSCTKTTPLPPPAQLRLRNQHNPAVLLHEAARAACPAARTACLALAELAASAA